MSLGLFKGTLLWFGAIFGWNNNTPYSSPLAFAGCPAVNVSVRHFGQGAVDCAPAFLHTLGYVSDCQTIVVLLEQHPYAVVVGLAHCCSFSLFLLGRGSQPMHQFLL
jgi:hypothetical protein